MSALVVYAAPATEPLTLAEVMAHLRLDEGAQEPAPGAPTVALASPAAAGNVDNGAHRYLVTYVTAAGETQSGTVSSAVTVADKAVNGKVSLTAIPLGGSAVTARKLYRTAAGGSTYLLLATLADNTTTTYTDNIADASLGAGAPSTNSTGDPLLSGLIVAARREAETRTNSVLITQTLDQYLDQFPCWELEVGLGKLQAVSEITYVDPDGTTQTLSSALYLVDANHERGRITPAYGQVWPATREQMNAVKIRYTAGYGAAAAVPQPIKQWMLLAIATWYAQREAVITGTIVSELPRAFWDALLDPYRIVRFA